MRKAQAVLVGSIAILLIALSSVAIFAQEATATVVPPPSFTDGRINDSTLLGGLAIYCVDANSNPVSTFENGAITVWGVGDQKYINLSAAQLSGDMEIPQQPSQMEAQMTLTPPMEPTATEMMMATKEPAVTMEMTDEAMSAMPILLARATTPTGDLAFFKLGAEEFALQGYDEQGNLFTYTWTGCTGGMVDHATEAYVPLFAATAMPEMTPEMTPEATASM